MKNKFYAICTMALSVWLISACESAHPTSETAASVAVVDNRPVYRVQTDNGYAPFNNKGEAGGIIGLDIDILQAIADNQGFRLEIAPQLWMEVFNAIKKNEADIIVGGIREGELIPVRQADGSVKHAVPYQDGEILFSDSYFPSEECLLATNKENLTDWNKRKIGAISTVDVMSLLLKNGMVANKSYFTPIDRPFFAVQALVKGNIDVFVAECAIAKHYVASPTFKDYTFHLQNLPTIAPKPRQTVIGVNPKQPELLAKINAGLANIKQNGEYDKILEKWNQKKP